MGVRPRIVESGCWMLFHSKSHVPIWLIIFALVWLYGSGTIDSVNATWSVFGGLAALAIVWTIVSTLWEGMASRRRDAEVRRVD